MLHLTTNDIHLWLVKPETITDKPLLERYWATVDASEAERIKKYRSMRQQHDALVTRVLVRYVLSQYTDSIAAQQWCFSSSEHGKPNITGPLGYQGMALSFNVSHTSGLIVCAVTVDHAIGCDAEWLQRRNSWQAIAEKYFSTQEQAALYSLPKIEQRRRFFDLWTLKESYVKACGQGLSMGLESISFDMNAAQWNSLNSHIKMTSSGSQGALKPGCQNWLLHPEEAFTVAITVVKSANSGPERQQLRCFDVTPLQSYCEWML